MRKPSACAPFSLCTLNAVLSSRFLAAVQAQGWRNKRWTAETETSHAGRPFTKASLERLLGNVVYIGQVRHKEKTYPGEQASIIEESAWREVQKLLAQERIRRQFRNKSIAMRTGTGAKSSGPRPSSAGIARASAGTGAGVPGRAAVGQRLARRFDGSSARWQKRMRAGVPQRSTENCKSSVSSCRNGRGSIPAANSSSG